MDFNLKVSSSINNKAVIALFGYLIKCNNQVHSFQEKIINHYISETKINDESIVKSVVYDYEDAIPFNEALIAFSHEDTKTKNEVYKFLIIVASIDGCIDNDEKVFLEKMKVFLDKDSAMSIEEKAQKKAVSLRKKMKKENAKGHTGRRANTHDNLFRIPQKEYVAAIEKCRKIACKDYEEILPVCEGIIIKGQNFLSEIDVAINSLNSDFHPEIKQIVLSFAKSFEESIIKKADEYYAQITRKSTTLEDFTIALIGETKAGKTTLRSVLTGEGYDGIGAGKQRTTRVNHVYEWNNLRIIDTPGIGAGSDFENTDKEIAKKAIYEADLICYVTVTDGKFGETKEFITEILKSNKPVHILINYKNNLLDEFNYEDFMYDPTDWCRQDGKNTIDGYFEPIRRIAVQNDVESLLSCSYVFLLAAWLSDDERYIKDSKILMKNSGLEEFLGKIKIIVTEQGAFLRSKTIIDDTIAVCESWRKNLLVDLQPVINCKESLESNRKDIEKKLVNQKIQFSKDIENIIKNQYRDLSTRGARQFVEDNIGCSKKELGNKWGEYCEKIEFNKKLENKLTHRFVEYSESLKEILDEVFDDIKFDIKIGVKDIAIKKTVSPPFKEIFTFLGGGIGLVGSILAIALNSNPVGWILTGVGLVVSIVSNLFKSKKERDKKAKDNLYNSLEKNVMLSYEKNKDNIQKQLETKAQELYAKVISTYDETLSGMRCVESAVANVVAEIDANINKMNYIFAERIIEYISNSSKVKIQGVERKFGECMTIYLKKSIEYDGGKLKGLMNENVEIVEKE